MKRDDPYYPGNDRRYEDLTEDQIPLTESLMDCMQRARPLWEYSISKEIKKGNTVLVVAHTNTLRGLMQVIDGKSVKMFALHDRIHACVHRSIALAVFLQRPVGLSRIVLFLHVYISCSDDCVIVFAFFHF